MPWRPPLPKAQGILQFLGQSGPASAGEAPPAALPPNTYTFIFRLGSKANMSTPFYGRGEIKNK